MTRSSNNFVRQFIPETFSSEIPLLQSVPSTPSPAPINSNTPPTPFPGDFKYQLLGCYNELPDTTLGRALGATGDILSPVFSSPEALTVPLCLEACAVAQVSEGRGFYIYAAVENSRECYCGFTLSDSSTSVDLSNCNSPCSAAPENSCGGNRYLNLYELRTALNGTYPSPTITAITSSSYQSAPSQSATRPPTSQASHMTRNRSLLPLWIALPVILVALAVLGFRFLFLRRKRTRKRRKGIIEEEVAATSNMDPQAEFVTGDPQFEGPQYNQPETSQGIGARRTPSGRIGEDGRRYGVIVNEVEYAKLRSKMDKPLPVIVDGGEEEGNEGGSERMKRRRTLDAWKSGVVPPLKIEHDTVGSGMVEGSGRQE